MPKFRKWAENEAETLYCFYCPGCKCEHVITSKIHVITGTLDKPTVSPSIGYFNWNPRCHSYVVDGRIQFLSDCTHELAGKTVELPDVDTKII